MGNEVNQYGLDRYIPAPIKRMVRQRCGFGCIECGTSIIQYHHFNPPFVNAQQHSAKGITLLCPTCHIKAENGILDENYIAQANKNPRCKQKGFVKDIFYVGAKMIAFKIGSAWFRSLNVVYYDNEPIISFAPPDVTGGPLRLNARIYDASEKQMLWIEDNEWKSGVDHFDFETKSNELIIREKPGEVKLKLTHIAGKEIFIERLNMKYKGFSIQVVNGQFVTTSPTGAKMILDCPNLFATLRLHSSGAISV